MAACLFLNDRFEKKNFFLKVNNELYFLSLCLPEFRHIKQISSFSFWQQYKQQTRQIFPRNHTAAVSWLADEIRGLFGINHDRPLHKGVKSDTYKKTAKEKILIYSCFGTEKYQLKSVFDFLELFLLNYCIHLSSKSEKIKLRKKKDAASFASSMLSPNVVTVNGFNTQIRNLFKSVQFEGENRSK